MNNNALQTLNGFGDLLNEPGVVKYIKILENENGSQFDIRGVQWRASLILRG
jgi:hypothetical protein